MRRSLLLLALLVPLAAPAQPDLRARSVFVEGEDFAPVGADWRSGQGHSRLYLGGQAGFYVSDDAGATWTSLESCLPGGIVDLKVGGVQTSGICDLALVPGEGRSTLFATIQGRAVENAPQPFVGGVYASLDGGRTWEERNNGLSAGFPAMAKSHRWSIIQSCPAAPGTLYWAGQNGVYKTMDYGQNWRLMTRPGTELVQGPDFDGRTVYWHLRTKDTNYERSFYNAYGPSNGLSCSPTNPNVVAYTDNATIGLSTDGGETWTEPGFEFGEALWPNEFGDRPPMIQTHKWRSRGIQLIVPQDLAVDPFDPATLAIGHADTGLEISRDNGQWWEWAYHGVLEGNRNYVRTVVYDPGTKGRLFIAGGGWNKPGQAYSSDDAGRTFTALPIPQLLQAAEQSKQMLVIHALALVRQAPPAAKGLYAATDAGLFYSADAGQTWAGPATGLGNMRVRHLALDPARPGRLYVTTRARTGTDPAAGLYRSDDGGGTWQRLGAAEIGPVQSLSLAAGTDTVYAIASAPGTLPGYWEPRALYRSDDAGQTWRKLDSRLASAIAVHPRDPQRLYYMTMAQDLSKEVPNVHRSTDGGATWQPIASDIPLSPGGEGNKIVFDPQNPARFFVLHNSGTYEGIEQ